MKQFTVTGRARHRRAASCAFPASLFPELVQKMPELAQRLVGLMSDRIRETTRMEQQRDRLASLGKLSAGLAHELNNPASAAKRATSQLRDILKKIATPATNWAGATSPPRRKPKSRSWKPRSFRATNLRPMR